MSDPRAQTYFVPGRGALRFTVQPGAGAVIVDLEGAQGAVLFVAGAAASGFDEFAREPGVSLSAFAAEFCAPEMRTAVDAACAFRNRGCGRDPAREARGCAEAGRRFGGQGAAHR